MNTLIGSRAYAYWDPSVPADSRDYDIISNEEWDKDLLTPRIEIHKEDEYLSREFVDRFQSSGFVEVHNRRVYVMSMRGLAAIKRSHLSLNHNWIKHISFYHKYLKQYLDQEDWEWIKAREKITLKIAKQRAPKLKQANDAFFDDYVEKKYDHDYIHELVAYHDKPLYTRLKHGVVKVKRGVNEICGIRLRTQRSYNASLKSVT